MTEQKTGIRNRWNAWLLLAIPPIITYPVAAYYRAWLREPYPDIGQALGYGVLMILTALITVPLTIWAAVLFARKRVPSDRFGLGLAILELMVLIGLGLTVYLD